MVCFNVRSLTAGGAVHRRSFSEIAFRMSLWSLECFYQYVTSTSECTSLDARLEYTNSEELSLKKALRSSGFDVLVYRHS